MAKRLKRTMIAMKADTADEQRVLAIRKSLHGRATVADALREALRFYCGAKKLDYSSVQLPERPRKSQLRGRYE